MAYLIYMISLSIYWVKKTIFWVNRSCLSQKGNNVVKRTKLNFVLKFGQCTCYGNTTLVIQRVRFVIIETSLLYLPAVGCWLLYQSCGSECSGV